MNSFIYDNYGYYVDSNKEEFEYKGFLFKLERNDYSEEELIQLNNLVVDIDASLFMQGARIIPNRSSFLSSIYTSSNISLVGVKIFEVGFSDVLKVLKTYLHYDKNSFSLISIKTLWENKLNLVKEKIMNSIKIDTYSYSLCQTIVYYALGLCENALCYLEDVIIDFSEKVSLVTITHKRFSNFSSYDLLNPLNLMVDSPIRDLAELYKFNCISVDEIKMAIEELGLSSSEVMYLFARILYPTPIFDLLEESYYKKEDIKGEIINIYNNIDDYQSRIKDIYLFLRAQYNIRPILWLDR